MSLKSLLSEITTGIWMIDSPAVAGYKDLMSGLRSGAFQKAEAEAFHAVIGKQEYNAETDETVVKDKVAVITFSGELTKNSALCNVGADMLISRIRQYDNDASVKSFIFKMDGPGGNASVMPMFNELEITKPVVSLIDRACSLHYYIAATKSDHLMMSNNFTAEAGSIGAMIMFEKPDKEMIIIRPPQSKDKNEELIQALDGNYELLEKRLEPLAIKFMADVKAARPKVSDDVLHGKVLYADEAIKAGLADSVGNMQQAYNLALALAELKDKK